MHHEQYPKFQSDYHSDVIALLYEFEQLKNHFLEDSGELLDLDQSIFMPPNVVDNVRKVRHRISAINNISQQASQLSRRGSHCYTTQNLSEVV